MKIIIPVQELAEQLNVTTRSIRNYLQEGKLHGTKAGGKWRFTEQDLYDFFIWRRRDQPIPRKQADF